MSGSSGFGSGLYAHFENVEKTLLSVLLKTLVQNLGACDPGPKQELTLEASDNPGVPSARSSQHPLRGSTAVPRGMSQGRTAPPPSVCREVTARASKATAGETEGIRLSDDRDLVLPTPRRLSRGTGFFRDECPG